MAINVLLLIREVNLTKFPCLLALGDNTSAIAWIFRSGKVKRNSRYYEAVKMIAREIAEQVMRAKAQLASQHLPGPMNDVSDLLSFSGEVRGYTNPLTADDPSDEELTLRIHEKLPQIVPQTFKISPLPNDVLSFVITVLQTLESSWSPNKKRAGRDETDHGGDGNISSGTWGWNRYCLEYPATLNSSLPRPLPSDTDCSTSTSRVQLLRSVRGPWYRRLSNLPLAMWLRRSGQITSRVPSTTKGKV